MVPYLTNTQNRLWAIFEQTVANWTQLVRPSNEIVYTGTLPYPPKRILGNKMVSDFSEVSIVPLSGNDQAYASPMSRTFAAMNAGTVGGSAVPIVQTEKTIYEIKLSFPDLRYTNAETLYLAMRTALLKAGPHLALVSPASPTQPGFSYVESWGPFPVSFKQEGGDGKGALRLVMRCNLSVNYRFQTTDLLA